jgi:hypothetical protein
MLGSVVQVHPSPPNTILASSQTFEDYHPDFVHIDIMYKQQMLDGA